MGTESRFSKMSRPFSVAALAVIAFRLLVIPATAGPGAEVWDELRARRPLEKGVSVAGVTLVRDAFTFRLDSGAFFPLGEVSGRIVGGVFKGKGRFELTPATESERAVLALRTGQEGLRILATTFKEAVFLFTDGTDKELLGAAGSVRDDAERLCSTYDDTLKKSTEHLHADLRLRLVPDIIEGRPLSHGLFMAAFKGEKLPPTVAVFSPDGLDRVWLDTANGPETTALLAFKACSSHYLSLPWYSAIASAPEISSAEAKRHSWLPSRDGLADPISVGWYSEGPAAASAGAAATAGPRALHYTIETTIHKNMDIEGRTTLRLRAGPGGVRVIPLDLFSKLRLATITQKSEAGMPIEIPFIQSGEESADPVLTILPRPLASGEETELEFAYRGNGVIQDDYDGMHILAPGDWYPVLNVGEDWAVYDLAYRIPRKRGIVSVGEFLGSSDDGEFKIYRFTTGGPVRGAAFNYGDFLTIERDDQISGVSIGVHISRISPYHPWTASQGDTLRTVWDVLADSLNTARVGTAYFGALVQNHITVSEQPRWGFGQSWPTLIYIPAIAFVESQLRVEAWRKEITPREFAHQWWGNSIGSATYRDAWLEDGLAEFTVALVLEKALGAKEARNFWERVRRDILDNGKIGPISLGRRLSSPETPNAYKTIVRYKGAFVIQMLRNLFREENSANPDQRFIEMMKDFAATWAGRNPATADFRSIVERHAPAALTGDMGWFFRQWIEGTAIPRIKATIRIDKAGEGRYRLKGRIIQSEVPGDFRSVLPICVELGRNQVEIVDRVTITGNRSFPLNIEISLPQKPLRVLVDTSYAWLMR